MQPCYSNQLTEIIIDIHTQYAGIILKPIICIYNSYCIVYILLYYLTTHIQFILTDREPKYA